MSLPPTLLVLSCLPSWQDLGWSWSPPLPTSHPQLSHPHHLPSPVKLPQFLSVQCRPAHFLIERCSEVQERRGAQCASVFGLAQKCFSWLNPLLLRSSYNKLKGPNCPQGKGLATIDMWWDKSPVLLPQHPHPSPDRWDEHVSSVCVALWVARPQVRHCKTLYIQYIGPVRHGAWFGKDLECLQFTANTPFPVSLHILFKVKGQSRRVYQIVSVTAVTVACCLSVSLEKMGNTDSGYTDDTEGWVKNYSCRRWDTCPTVIKTHFQGVYINPTPILLVFPSQSIFDILN